VLTPTYKVSSYIEGNTLKYMYTFSGVIDRTMYFKIDEQDPLTKDHSKNEKAENVTYEIDITDLSHGVHTLEV
jgi:hypothetical protein